jgi:hypothetical protein
MVRNALAISISLPSPLSDDRLLVEEIIRRVATVWADPRAARPWRSRRPAQRQRGCDGSLAGGDLLEAVLLQLRLTMFA